MKSKEKTNPSADNQVKTNPTNRFIAGVDVDVVVGIGPAVAKDE